MSIADNPSLVPAQRQATELNEMLEFGYAPRHRADLEVAPVEDTFKYTVETETRRSIASVGKAALKGAIVGPFQQIKEIGGEIKQAVSDYRSIKELTRETETTAKHKFGVFAMKAWYAAPLPAYQVADDSLTYPLYLQMQDQFNTGTAYGVAAGTTFALAAAMGYGQHGVEKKKAAIMNVPTVDDDSDNVPLVLDATVNSAPWQVVRKANEPREEGDPVKIVRRARIAQYAAAYATVNTVLYTAAEKMPMNEWAGFGAMLWGVWAVSGAYREVKKQVIAPEQLEEEN